MITRCPEAFAHGPADAQGRCPWCGQRCEPPVSRPRGQRFEPSDLTEAYGEFYDPDYGTLTPAQIRRRYQMGQDA